MHDRAFHKPHAPTLQARLKCAFPYRSGAELTFDVLLEVAVAILSEPNNGFVLVCGTDTLEEAAFALHLMLGLQLQSCGKTLVVTGAMLPADALGSDGPTNLRDAIQVVQAC
jgi:L-asparaginase